MDPSNWTRAPEKVNAALTVLEDGSLVTAKPLKIYIPERYVEKQLAVIAAETYIVGIFAMVVDDKHYAVSTTNAMMRVKPTTVSTVKFGDDTYLEFAFDPGSVVIATVDLIRSDTLVYVIFDEFIAKGRVPWFMNLEDMATLFDSAEKHAGVNLGKHHSILEMFAAAIARDSDNRARYYRHTLSDTAAGKDKPPTFIPLRSITYGATNTTAKLMGSYWNDGLTSALVNPSEKTERIEQLLRR